MLSAIRHGMLVVLLAGVIRPDAAFGNEVKVSAPNAAKGNGDSKNADCKKPVQEDEGCKVVRKKKSPSRVNKTGEPLKKAG